MVKENTFLVATIRRLVRSLFQEFLRRASKRGKTPKLPPRMKNAGNRGKIMIMKIRESRVYLFWHMISAKAGLGV